MPFFTAVSVNDAIAIFGDSDEVHPRVQGVVCRAFSGTEEGCNTTFGPHCEGRAGYPDHHFRWHRLDAV